MTFNSNPGPSDQNPIEKLNSQLKILKQSFNKSKKIINLEPDQSPGPGKYKLPSVFSNKSFKFNNRVMRDYSNDIPGPGEYIKDVNKQINNSYTIGNELRFKSSEFKSEPGPTN